MSSPARLLAVLTLLVAAYGIALPVVPLAIRVLAPPVRDFTVTAATRMPDGRIRMTAHMEKKHCVFTALRFTWHGVDGDVWRVGYAATDQPPGVDTDRPPGVQSLGPWLVGGAPTEDATVLKVTVRHRCGPFAVVTALATLDFSSKP